MKKWLISLLFLAGCTGQSGPGDLLKQANRVHLEAVALYNETHELYDSLKKQAKADQDSLLLSRLDSLHKLMHSWEDGLYEVPGFEHDHGGHDGDEHKHEHKTAPKMTDQSMLEYQESARAAIEELKKGFLLLSKPE